MITKVFNIVIQVMDVVIELNPVCEGTIHQKQEVFLFLSPWKVNCLEDLAKSAVSLNLFLEYYTIILYITASSTTKHSPSDTLSNDLQSTSESIHSQP